MTVATTKPLGSLLRRRPRYGINAAAVPLAPGVPNYLRITDIDEAGRFAPHPQVGVAHPKSADYKMHGGELVFARTGASVGKSYLYDSRDGELIYAGFLINIAPDPKLLNPKYLSLFAQSKEYWDWIARTSVRSGQPGVNGQEYAQLPVPLPDIAVQKAIADAMTDADDLVATLERLIAKKQAIKQGMMQELLSGRTRLPGFDVPWREVTLGELESLGELNLFRGKVISRLDIAAHPGPYPIYSSSVHHGGLFGRYGLYMLDEELITWSVDGGGNFFYRPRHKFSVTNVCGYVRVLSNATDTRFLSYQLQMQHARLHFDYTLKAHPSVIRSMYHLALPELDEQRAIATALADVDDEITLLDKRLTKARNIRTGMVQGLLTGRAHLSSAVER